MNPLKKSGFENGNLRGLVLAVLVFFSIASSKRDDYILPAMPGLAILFAALFTGAL